MLMRVYVCPMHAQVDLTEPAPAAKIFNTSSPGRVSASPRGIPVPRPRTAAAAAVAGASAGAADRVGAIQAAHIARHASQPFAGQGTVRNPSPIFQISPVGNACAQRQPHQPHQPTHQPTLQHTA